MEYFKKFKKPREVSKPQDDVVTDIPIIYEPYIPRNPERSQTIQQVEALYQKTLGLLKDKSNIKHIRSQRDNRIQEWTQVGEATQNNVTAGKIVLLGTLIEIAVTEYNYAYPELHNTAKKQFNDNISDNKSMLIEEPARDFLGDLLLIQFIENEGIKLSDNDETGQLLEEIPFRYWGGEGGKELLVTSGLLDIGKQMRDALDFDQRLKETPVQGITLEEVIETAIEGKLFFLPVQ